MQFFRYTEDDGGVRRGEVTRPLTEPGRVGHTKIIHYRYKFTFEYRTIYEGGIP